MSTHPFDQSGFPARFGWRSELPRLGEGAAAIVVVDVLRFTSCVSVAVARGAEIFPYAWDDEGAATFAREHDAELAGRRGDPLSQWSLSPTDLDGLPPGTRLVLPSPNGAVLSLHAATAAEHVYAGCLRNARSLGRALAGHLPLAHVAVIAAGEMGTDSSGDAGRDWRPAVEDLLGAGAVIESLCAVADLGTQEVSPEARTAVAAFRCAQSDLQSWLMDCASGRELIARGCADDVITASQLHVDSTVPRLFERAFTDATGPA